MSVTNINAKIDSVITDLALAMDKQKFAFDAKTDEYYKKGETFQVSLDGKKLENELRAQVARMENISDEINQLMKSKRRISSLFK